MHHALHSGSPPNVLHSTSYMYARVVTFLNACEYTNSTQQLTVDWYLAGIFDTVLSCLCATSDE